MKRMLAILAALALTLAPVGSADAAKGGKGGKTTGTLALVMVVDNNGNGLPNWADSITWDVATDKTAYPYVSVACYQGSALIYTADAGFYDTYPWRYARVMPLDSQAWADGTGADCVAQLYWNDGLRKRVVEAETTFTVAP